MGAQGRELVLPQVEFLDDAARGDVGDTAPDGPSLPSREALGQCLRRDRAVADGSCRGRRRPQPGRPVTLPGDLGEPTDPFARPLRLRQLGGPGQRPRQGLKEAAFPILNIDLIYGIDGQTEQSFRVSLDAALAWEPEEIYLYPLYVRPLTGLMARHDKSGELWDEQRLRLYRYGRDHLLAAGYRQTSMRVFSRIGTAAVDGADDSNINEYNQQAGMVGLGAGARSFTTALHYTTDYAVAVPEVRRIIDDYIATPTEEFHRAQWSFRMDDDERRRMFVLGMLLESDGLRVERYRAQFGTVPQDDFGPQLALLAERGWLADDGGVLRLTPEGTAWADAIGPLFFSPRVNEAMASYRDR
ncbi:hypothetical protein ABTY53_25065 [Streptomyces noursei]|uniref:hypothetical protein n=1 Tax=Streptomyces noursei TaxID=1971 RepID=UPI00331FA13E